MKLDSDEVHLWTVDPNKVEDNRLIAFYESLLSPDEDEQKKRFRFDQHRHQYVVSRALVRTTLSRYAPYAPESWRFFRREQGRPEIVLTEGMPPLRFNLSHTAGMIACAVTISQDLGVDVENMDRNLGILPIAQRYFSAAEMEFLTSLSAGDQRTRFFQYWTLKESYGKATGIGLSLPMKKLTFYQSDPLNWQISFDASIPGNPGRWQFWVSFPTPHHALAISLNRPGGRNFHLRIQETVPM